MLFLLADSDVDFSMVLLNPKHGFAQSDSKCFENMCEMLSLLSSKEYMFILFYYIYFVAFHYQ